MLGCCISRFPTMTPPSKGFFPKYPSCWKLLFPLSKWGMGRGLLRVNKCMSRQLRIQKSGSFIHLLSGLSQYVETLVDWELGRMVPAQKVNRYLRVPMFMVVCSMILHPSCKVTEMIAFPISHWINIRELFVIISLREEETGYSSPWEHGSSPLSQAWGTHFVSWVMCDFPSHPPSCP